MDRFIEYESRSTFVWLYSMTFLQVKAWRRKCQHHEKFASGDDSCHFSINSRCIALIFVYSESTRIDAGACAKNVWITMFSISFLSLYFVFKKICYLVQFLYVWFIIEFFDHIVLRFFQCLNNQGKSVYKWLPLMKKMVQVAHREGRTRSLQIPAST